MGMGTVTSRLGLDRMVKLVLLEKILKRLYPFEETLCFLTNLEIIEAIARRWFLLPVPVHRPSFDAGPPMERHIPPMPWFVALPWGSTLQLSRELLGSIRVLSGFGFIRGFRVRRPYAKRVRASQSVSEALGHGKILLAGLKGTRMPSKAAIRFRKRGGSSCTCIQTEATWEDIPASQLVFVPLRSFV